jgi:hypothetical protein
MTDLARLLGPIDIYLLDQMMKGRVEPGDAGGEVLDSSERTRERGGPCRGRFRLDGRGSELDDAEAP